MNAPRSSEKPAVLRILVIGYYGHLNAGDDLLQQAMTYIFQDHKLMFSSWQPGITCLHECDLVVVGGGSIWPDFAFFQHADAYARQLKVPLFVIGISSRRQEPAVLAKTHRLIETSRLFHVRDLSTYREFGSPLDVRHGVDLFWWMPWSIDRETAASRVPKSIAVNLRGWDVDWHPAKVLDTIRLTGLRLLPLPLYFGSPSHDANIRVNDAEFLGAAGLPSRADHWSEQNLLQADLCVAMRYHAILMSTRCAIPAVGFDFHPKMVAFFEENGISELCVPLSDTDRLQAAIACVLADYDGYVDRFRAIADRLREAGEADFAHCRGVLAAIAPRRPAGILARVLRRALQLFS